MSDTLKLGVHVQHSIRGLGKIVHLDAAEVHVYFRDIDEEVPDKRVRRFKTAAWSLLQCVETESDPVLDGLAPWNGEKFIRPATSDRMKPPPIADIQSLRSSAPLLPRQPLRPGQRSSSPRVVKTFGATAPPSEFTVS